MGKLVIFKNTVMVVVGDLLGQNVKSCIYELLGILANC